VIDITVNMKLLGLQITAILFQHFIIKQTSLNCLPVRCFYFYLFPIYLNYVTMVPHILEKKGI